MKLNINAVNFEIAEHLNNYIEKKTRRYERLLPGEDIVMELRLTVVKPETNLNKHTQIRILGNGPELFAEKTCDTFEQGIDLCLDALDKQIEKLKQR